jgi:hypothetical protein
MRLNMSCEDIANTILDIYADVGGCNNAKQIIRNIDRMMHKGQPGSQKAVDERFASTTGTLGMTPTNQRDYLVEYRDLHPETKKTIRRSKSGHMWYTYTEQDS